MYQLAFANKGAVMYKLAFGAERVFLLLRGQVPDALASRALKLLPVLITPGD